MLVGNIQVGQSCKAYFAADKCIKIEGLYVQDGNFWKEVNGQTVTGLPTTIFTESRGGHQQITFPAYKYIFVSDTRDVESPKSVVGITASRHFSGGNYSNISIYKNAPETRSAIDRNIYTKYLSRHANIRGRNVLMEEWMEIFGYDVDDKSDEAFIYPTEDAGPNFWQLSLKLRQNSGLISCIPFELSHVADVSSVRFRIFLQHNWTDARYYSHKF